MDRVGADMREKIMVYAQIGYWYMVPGKEIWWDDSLYALYGMEKTDKGINVEAFKSRVYPPDYKKWSEELDLAIEKRTDFSVRARINIEGEYKWVLVKGFLWDDNRLWGFTQVINDYVEEYKELKDLLTEIKFASLDHSRGLEKIQNMLE